MLLLKKLSGNLPDHWKNQYIYFQESLLKKLIVNIEIDKIKTFHIRFLK
jgi:hypothetical protein